MCKFGIHAHSMQDTHCTVHTLYSTWLFKISFVKLCLHETCDPWLAEVAILRSVVKVLKTLLVAMVHKELLFVVVLIGMC